MAFQVPCGPGMFDDADVPFGDTALESIFTQHLSNIFPGYTPRHQQVEMARAVQSVLVDKANLFCEAPCGVGKSLAYGIPAALLTASKMASASGESKQRVIISTAGIALQEQLITKDLPTIRKLLNDHLGLDFTFALFKGWANYACHIQVQLSEHNGMIRSKDKPKDVERVGELLEWYKDTRTGDKSELDFDPAWDLWNRLAIQTDDCAGNHCSRRDDCFPHMAKIKAFRSDIIVTNHHMLLLALTNGMIPANSYVILDEAHELPDIARRILGGELTLGKCTRALYTLKDALGIIPDPKFKEAFTEDFRELAVYSKSPEYSTRLKKPGFMGNTYALEAEIGQLMHMCQEAQDNADEPTTKTLAKKAHKALANIVSTVTMIHTLNEDFVYALERGQYNSDVSIDISKIDVSKDLRGLLFNQMTSVIATSATMTSNNSFGYMLNDTGAPTERTKLLAVDSPFNFQANSMLIIPKTEFANTNSEEWRKEVGALCRAVVKIAKGRTLCLFTSNKQMNIAYNYLQGLPYDIICQGDGPKIQLIKQFRDNINSVLLGVTSMWTGVDVSGESLSCLFIDKLPFPMQSDPVLDAITERNPRGWFTDYSLPRTMLTMKQGVGRMIRSLDDRGVCVIADQRLMIKKYGPEVIRSLPPMRRGYTLDDMEDFFAAGLVKPIVKVQETPPKTVVAAKPPVISSNPSWMLD